MSMMDFTAIKCLVPLVTASFLPFGLASAATGDSVVNAEALGSVTETVQTKSVRFVEAAGWIDPGGGSGWSYDDDGDDWSGGSGDGWDDWGSEAVYFYRVSLTPGKDYTFWLDDRPDNWIDMSMFGYDESNGWGESTAPKTQIFDRGGGYFRVLAGEWDAADTAPADYIIEINGGSDHAANAYAGTLHYVQGAYDKGGEIRNGTKDRPTELGEITDAVQSRSFSANSVDMFHYVSCSLVAGRKYVFSVKSGTSANPAFLELMADEWSGLSTNGAVYSVSGNNVTVTFAPGTDGLYLLRLSCEHPTPGVTYELEYSVIRPLKPSEHGRIVTIGRLTPGVRTLCEPGDVVKAGSTYYDTVIDEQLFVFAAQAGHRYKVVTDSATAGIFGEIYDGDGNVLAASGDSLAPGDNNIQFGFAAASSADCYLGVALRGGREGRLQPVKIGLTLTDITDVQSVNDAFDPADDAFVGATLLSPALVGREGVAPVNANSDVRDVHTLSETDWCDTFCVDCRKGQTYSFQIATVDGARPAQGVRAGICRLVDGIPVAVESRGTLEADTTRNIVQSFVPSEDGRHYLTLVSSVGNSVGYPPYKLHSTVCTAGDDWDEKDSERAGATTLAMGPTPATNAVHTLWAGDAADWYRFEPTEGSFCSVKFVDRSGDAVMSLYDAEGKGILGERTSVSFAVPATGTYFLKVSHPSGGLSMDGTYRLETMSVNVGTISFERTSVNATEDDGFVALKVQRTSGEGAVRIRWGTLSGTAKAGEDYFAAQEELALAAGETEGTLTVRLIPDLIAKAEPDKVFYVRIEPVSADGLSDAEYPIAVTGPATATVTLTDTGDAPSVEISLGGVSAVGNAESLSMGTFAGVLLEEDGYFQTNAVMSFAKVASLVSAADGTYATVEIDGKSQMFIGAALADAGDGYAYGNLTSDDDKDILSVAVPTGMVASLATSVPHSAIAELRRQVPAAGGSTDEVHYLGRLFRTDNAKYTEIRKRLFDGATAQTDRYTAVLRSSDEGDGYLAISVETNGTVIGTGKTPDGRDFSFKSFAAAYLSESDASVTPSFGIPFVASSGDGFAIGGTMSVSLTFRGEGDIDRLLWVDDGRRDFFGRTFRTELEPVGGRFDGTLNLTAYFKNRDLVLSRDGSDVSITGNAMTGGQTERLDLTIDPLTGVASGALGERICGGVIVQRSDESTAFDLDNVAFGGVAVGSGGAETVRVISAATSRDETETKWGFKSTVTFNGNGADDPATVPQDETHFVGEAIRLPQPAGLKKDGFVFKGWRSAVWGVIPPGGEYHVPAIAETLVADWQYSVVGFAEALDCQEVFTDDDFETGGASPWHIDMENVARGVSSIRSGRIAAATNQWIRAQVPFNGELSFIWSCDIDNGGTAYAKYVFATNGVDVATIGAKTEWTTQTVDVVAGTVLTWTLSKAKDAYSYPRTEAGQDWVWLDGLRLGRKTTVTFLAEGGEPKTEWTTNVTGFAGQETLGDYLAAMPVAKWNSEMVTEWLSPTGGVVTLDWVFPDKDTELTPVVEPRTFTLTYDANGGAGAVPVDVHGYTNREEAVLLPPGDLCRDGYAFDGWTIGGEPYKVGATYVFGADDATAVAQWTLDVAAALKGPGLENLNFEETSWGQDSVDGELVMRSGVVGKGGESVLKAKALASGSVSFTWKCETDVTDKGTRYAGCTFAVNGVERAFINGRMTGWATVEEIPVAAGDELTWTFWRAGNAYDVPPDCAWLERVSFGRKTPVTFEPGDDCETDLPPKMMYAGERFGEGGNVLPSDETAKWTNHSLDHWYLKGDAEEKDVAGTLIPSNAVTLVAKLVAKRRYVRFYDEDGVTPLHDPLSGVAGETVTLPGTNDVPKKTGYLLTGWWQSDAVISCACCEVQGWHGPGGTFTFPTNDTTMIAEWTLDFDHFDEILGSGAKAFSFARGWWSSSDWVPDGQSLRSGKIESSRESALTAIAKSSGELTFEWTTSCDEDSGCCFVVVRDGRTVLERRLTGETAWMKETVDVQTGDELRWCYYKKSATASGQDCAWIRDFKFGRKTMVTFRAESTHGEVWTTNVTGYAGADTLGDYLDAMPKAVWATEMVQDWLSPTGGVVTLDWAFPEEDVTLVPVTVVPRTFSLTYDANGGENAPVDGHGYTNREEAVLLPPGDLRREGYAFNGWTIGGDPYKVGATYVFGAEDATAVAKWTLDMKAALKGPGLENLNFEETSWGQDRVGDELVMRSGVVGKGGESVLKAKALSSGSVSFSWKCETDVTDRGTRYAGCTFRVNGVERAFINGKMADWATVEDISVSADDELTWTFWRAGNAYDVAPDCAWLRCVSFGRKTTVTFRAEGGEPKTVWTTNVTGFAGQDTLGDYLEAMPVAKWNTEMVTEWKTNGGERVTLAWVFPEEDVTLVPVAAVPRTFTLTYDANGGENAPVDGHGYTNREEAVLLPPGDLQREGYLFNGWMIGGEPYKVGATYVFGADDATAVAQWTLDYASVLGCSGANLSFASSGELPWQIVSNDVDCCSLDWSPRILQSAWIVTPLDNYGCLAEAKRSAFSVTANEAGKLTFSWRVSCDDADDTKYAWTAYVVRGVETRISSKSGTEWRTVSLDLEEGETVTWTYGKEKSSYCKPNPNAKEDRACLKDFVWVPAAPSTVSFTVNWTTDAGGYPLSEVGYVVDNVTNAPVSGEPFEVERGKTVRITATVAEWNIATGLGDYLADADTVVTISTAFIGQALSDETKTATEVAEAYGITNPEFRGVTAAAKLMLVKAVTWATGHGLGVAEINRISFDGEGNPVTPEAEAYLLDVDPGDATELSEARAAFRFTAFAGTAASARIGVNQVGDGGDYGNGKVLIRAYADPACQRRVDEPEKSVSACFYRAYLVR